MNALTEQVLPIIRETREMLAPHWGIVEIEATKNGSPHDVVTKIDLEVEKFLADKLTTLAPGTGFRGEEFGGSGSESKFWLCDPIDGTGFFVRGLPGCSSMLALIEDGVVVFASIYDFVNDALFYAERGGGAFKNDAAIHVSQRPLSEAFLGMDTHVNKPENMQKFLELRKKSIMLSYTASGAIYSQIAEGKVDGRICLDPWGKDWDFAPGSLLVQEAGGIVANVGARAYDYRNLDCIAANREVFQELTEGPGAIFPITG